MSTKNKKPAKSQQHQQHPREVLATIEGLNKKLGEGTVMLGETIVAVDVVPTGIATLDQALGCGGLPRGRVIELYGPESSGKTTLALHIAAACQQRFKNDQYPGQVVYIDVEHALDPVWARKLGVDMDNCLLSQPDSAEDALLVAEHFIKSGQVHLVVIDSVASLAPKAELDGEITDNVIGLQARLMSKALRTWKGSLHDSLTIVLFINQIRHKIGVTWGSPETTPGGLALKFYSSIRLDIRKLSQIKESNESKPDGFYTRVKIVKNKVAPPFREAVFDICFGTNSPICGINKMGSLLDVAKDLKIVELAGSWFNYGEQRLGNGRDSAVLFLHNTPAVTDEIKSKVYEQFAQNNSNGSLKDLDDEELAKEVAG